MFKKILASIGLSLLALFASYSFVIAQEVPERDGVYDVPGRPNLRVRVFVHGPKPATLPTFVCSPDNESAAVVNPAGWHLPSSVGYKLNVSGVPSSLSGNLPTIASNAFSAWAAATDKVAFSDIGITSADRANLDGQNIVAWGRTQGTALAVTYTWYNKSTNQAVETDTIMNKKFSWSWNMCGSNTYDAQDILTHELGHWMGLNDEYGSGYVDNTMYGYGAKSETKKDTLTTGDKQGIFNIYH